MHRSVLDMVGSVACGFNIRLEGLAAAHSNFCTYEPGQFCLSLWSLSMIGGERDAQAYDLATKVADQSHRAVSRSHLQDGTR